MSTTLTGPRWSSAVQCARRAVYEGVGAPREEATEEQEGYFRRGRLLGLVRAQELDEQLVAAGRPKGQAEREIPWPPDDPVGVGHADYYIPDELELIEVTSTEGCELPAHKVLQLAGYIIFDRLATNGRVLSIDPASLAERAYRIDPETFRDEVERIASQVVAGIRDGVLPDRPAHVESPTQRPCFGCPFLRECWKHWEPHPVGTLPASVHDDLRRLAELEDDCARYKNVPHLEAEREEIRDKLAGMMAEGGVYRGGGISVKWTGVEGRRTFRLADYEKAGHRLPDVAEGFINNGKGHRRWTVRRLEDAAP